MTAKQFMTKAELYNKTFLALIPPVTQAYILKNSPPFAGMKMMPREHFEERQDEMESIAEMADLFT
jgi:hypothetical protein